MLGSLGIDRAEVIGLGFGAVVAIELAVAEPDLIAGVTAIEPPVFGLLTSATEGVSRDVELVRAAAGQGGPQAAYELYLAGDLTTVGAGAERFDAVADRGPDAATTLLLEIAAVPAWPIDHRRIDDSGTGIRIATNPTTPPILIEAANALSARLEHGERIFAVGQRT